MGPNWLARITTDRHGPVVAAGLLGLAAAGQAIARAATTTAGDPVPYAALLCLLALAGTVPLAVLRPAPAAVTITAANAALFAFGALPAAGAAAQVIAAYRLGAAGELTREPSALGETGRTRWAGALGEAGRARWAGALGEAGRARWSNTLGETGTRYLAVALAVPFLVLALAVPFLVLALTSHANTAAVLLAALVPAAAGTGIAVRARRTDRTQTAALEEIADTLSEHTARGERARIARELHDVVAHHISMIAVQAETARLTTAGLPVAGAQRFTEIGDTARAGLTEMRRLLGVLREDADALVADRHPQPGLPQLTELVDAARTASGAGTRLIVSGPVAEFDSGVELAAFRIVQEALTNARRHAPGAAVDVELHYADDALRLRIRDNGPGPGKLGESGKSGKPPSGGHGLLGMRERAATVGGSLRIGAAPGGGFCVEAILPAKPDAPIVHRREAS